MLKYGKIIHGDYMQISKSSEIIKDFKNVIKNINKYPNLTVSDDLQVLKIVYEYGYKIDTLLYVEKDYHDDTKLLLENLKKISNNYYEISESTYSSLSLKENHVGIIATIILKEYTLDDFKDKEFLVVLDALEIPGNIGTIYRTLESINVDGLLLVNPVSKMNNLNITSSSRGSSLIIPTISGSYEELSKYLLDNNYDIYLGEPELGKNYQEYDYKNKIALVFGNERFGINPDWYNHKHLKVYIPMEGRQNSLNVGVATSIIAYEAYMKRQK